MMDSWRREKAAWNRMRPESVPKRYPEVGDPPPGKIEFAFHMIVMCGVLGWMLFS